MCETCPLVHFLLWFADGPGLRDDIDELTLLRTGVLKSTYFY